MAKLSIAIVIQDLRMRGGMERRTSELVKQLLAAGHEVHIYANRWDPRAAEGASFHRVPMLKVPRALKPLSFAWCASWLARRGGHDLVHTQARIYRYDVITLGVGCHRAFLEAVGIDPEKSRDKWFHRAVLHIERRMFAPGSYRRIITNSNKCKREIGQHYAVPEGDVTVVHNGVDLEAFSPERRAGLREAARAELGLEPDETAILLVGTGFEHKGVETLTRALGILGLRGRAGRIRALIAGGGKSDQYQETAADLGVADRLIWAGRIGNIASYHAAADVFTLPTRYDAFSNSTLEALASGLPVVTTRTNGASEILSDGENAFIIEPNDPEALAERLDALAQDSELRTSLGLAGRKAVEPYTWRRTAEQTMAVYKAIMADRSKT